jgi:hypothetical protein
MTLNKNELEKICLFCKTINSDETLNGDDIDDIKNALKIFNGD